MMVKRSTSIWRVTVAMAASGVLLSACASGSDDAAGAGCDETLLGGISAPMSGAAAGWGIGYVYAAEQAAREINDDGGVTVGDMTYCFEIVSYDNKYNAADSAAAAQNLIQKDQVDFIAGSIGTVPTRALQSLSEPAKLVHFTVSWGPELKGSDFPFTFTIISSPSQVIPPLYQYVAEENPSADSVYILNPNDATGDQVSVVAEQEWIEVGVEVRRNEFYERGTTDFAAIATRIIQADPAIMDMGTMPAGEAGLLMRALVDQGWDGVRVAAVAESTTALVNAGGDAVENTYLGTAGDYGGDNATEIQQKLTKGLEETHGETPGLIAIGGYDAVMAYAAGLKKAGTIDSDAIRKALPELIIEGSYGPSVFDAKEFHGGTPNQFLIPIRISQVQNGETVELQKTAPEALERRLEELR